MQSSNPAIPGCTFSILLNGCWARKQEKCWQTTFFDDWCSSTFACCSCCNLQCCGFPVTFNNDAKLPPKWILREFSIANPTLTRRVTPPWNVYMAKFDPGWEGYPVWQTGLPTLAGHVNVIKLKWEIIWTGRLPHLSGLPHLPRVPHLHVNRP